jgi:hypothetical protein
VAAKALLVVDVVLDRELLGLEDGAAAPDEEESGERRNCFKNRMNRGFLKLVGAPGLLCLRLPLGVNFVVGQIMSLSVMSCHFVSYHVIKCHIMSLSVISCH